MIPIMEISKSLLDFSIKGTTQVESKFRTMQFPTIGKRWFDKWEVAQIYNLSLYITSYYFYSLQHINISLNISVTHPAPNFTANAVVNGEIKQVSLSDFQGKYVIPRLFTRSISLSSA